MGNVVKTLLWLVLFWFVFLLVLPLAVSVVEIELGIQRFPPQLVLAAVLLGIFTLLGLWSALTLAVAGRGTPAPFARTQELVVTGPYAYVRHPFAIAFTGQAVAIGIAMGSVPVIAYAAVSLAVYYFFVRPREEQALVERFGVAVNVYTRAVRGFRPRLKPYRLSPSD